MAGTPVVRSLSPAAGTPAVHAAAEDRPSHTPARVSATPLASAGANEVPARVSSVPRKSSPAAGIPATRPSTPAARLKTQAQGAAPEPAKQVAKDAAPGRAQPEPKGAPADVTPRPAVIAEPLVARAADAVSQRAQPTSLTPAADAPIRSQAVDSGYPRPARSARFWLTLGVLWVVTATIPALVVWASMRSTPRNHSAIGPEKREVPPLQKPMVQEATPKQPDGVAKPSEAAITAASISEPAALGTASSAAPSTSASPASSAPVVVETESTDRVDVLVKSRPTGAKVYRRAKEIGHTPLTIQIGRGEHRIFEVGWTHAGSKRISVDGEKPEITVNLATEPKPGVSGAIHTPATSSGQ